MKAMVTMESGDNPKEKLKKYQKIAQAVTFISICMGCLCCMWTLSAYMSESSLLVFSLFGAVPSMFLFIALLLEWYKHKNDGTITFKMLSCLEKKGRSTMLVHLAQVCIIVFSLCVAGANIYALDTSEGLYVISVIVLLLQASVLVFCVPCNGIQLALLNCYPADSPTPALLAQQYLNAVYISDYGKLST